MSFREGIEWSNNSFNFHRYVDFCRTFDMNSSRTGSMYFFLVRILPRFPRCLESLGSLPLPLPSLSVIVFRGLWSVNKWVGTVSSILSSCWVRLMEEGCPCFPDRVPKDRRMVSGKSRVLSPWDRKWNRTQHPKRTTTQLNKYTKDEKRVLCVLKGRESRPPQGFMNDWVEFLFTNLVYVMFLFLHKSLTLKVQDRTIFFLIVIFLLDPVVRGEHSVHLNLFNELERYGRKEEDILFLFIILDEVCQHSLIYSMIGVSHLLTQPCIIREKLIITSW